MWNENIEESMKHGTCKMEKFRADPKLKRSLKYAKIARDPQNHIYQDLY